MNNKNLFKILSIDFDFFANVTQKELMCYPDGVDLPTELTELVWATHYATNGNILKNIDIDKDLYRELTYIINSQSINTPVLITNSHIHAFDFIEQHFDNKRIMLTNIDWHHDIINNNPEMDCGNWIKFLKEKYPDTVLQWITRKASVDCYGLTDEEIKKMFIEFDFSSIEHTQFDAIFLCRSDSWTPPHLDKYFDDLIKNCFSAFFDAKIEKCVMQPRDADKIKNTITNVQNIS